LKRRFLTPSGPQHSPDAEWPAVLSLIEST
jgi:hypothetical protein